MRLHQQIPKHFSPEFDLSIWLADNENTSLSINNHSVIATEEVQTLVNRVTEQKCSEQNVRCTVTCLEGIFVHPKTGRRSQTLRMKYYNKIGQDESEICTGAAIPRETAKEIHSVICDEVVNYFGVETR
uniref:Uncharacterized protein n=2 Tax=Ditylum brightwellii TaxID=49249 RepID=A0A7S4SPC9_9STRA